MEPFTHHAYLVSADRISGISRVKDMLSREWGFETVGNPDMRVWDTDSFSIDEAHDVRDCASRKSLGARQAFLLAGDTFTREAQNALLKVLEEPGEGTHFFIITPYTGILLPTLLSRLARLDTGAYEKEGKGKAEIFLAQSVPERLASLEKMIKDKDKRGAMVLLDAIITILHERAQHGGAETFGTSAPLLTELSEMRGYLTDTSSSVKLIMEHVALSLPEEK